MHGLNVTLVKSIATHGGSNWYITWGARNLQGDKKIKLKCTNGHCSSNYQLLKVMCIPEMLRTELI